jgi:hypothetical protein
MVVVRDAGGDRPVQAWGSYGHVREPSSLHEVTIRATSR